MMLYSVSTPHKTQKEVLNSYQVSAVIFITCSIVKMFYHSKQVHCLMLVNGDISSFVTFCFYLLKSSIMSKHLQQREQASPFYLRFALPHSITISIKLLQLVSAKTRRNFQNYSPV
ncbi:hypothetical protein GOODEAATRI_031947 [Goodea atripinnis]|uniref:Uncharacterized protein n=1 Tax=Goodea atripinnis TaxID=208336 RepID=A0ABV0PTD7_9TELE